MNKQREVIYKHRRAILAGEDLSDQIGHMALQVADSLLDVHCPQEQYPEEWDYQGLVESVHGQFGVTVTHNGSGPGAIEELKEMGRDALSQELHERVEKAYKQKESELGPELLRQLEKMVMLQVIDHHWKDHLLSMDHLRDGIGLRGYGQKDPLIEYKREGYDMFAGMMSRIKGDVLDRLFHIQAVRGEAPPAPAPRPAAPLRLTLNRGEEEPQPQAPVQRTADKVGRNDPCPCGSGKKYKKCHGA